MLHIIHLASPFCFFIPATAFRFPPLPATAATGRCFGLNPTIGYSSSYQPTKCSTERILFGSSLHNAPNYLIPFYGIIPQIGNDDRSRPRVFAVVSAPPLGENGYLNRRRRIILRRSRCVNSEKRSGGKGAIFYVARSRPFLATRDDICGSV